MSSGTTAPRSPIQRRPPGPLIAAGAAAAVRGLVFAGLMFAEAGLALAVALELVFAICWFPLLWIPGTLLAMRRLANRTRRLAGEWCGVQIAAPYRPAPGAGARGEDVSRWRRFGWLLADQATWRDLLWALADPACGWLLAVLPASLLAWGLFGVIMPAVWSPIVHAGGNNWYAFIDVNSAGSAWLSVPLGVAFAMLGTWAGPRLLRAYGRYAHWLLAPTRQAELALRVRHLTQTRAGAMDAGAAEMRRIERDLHDGAQARLVAMGMTLSAAERVLESNPEAARALLLEARDSSAKALAELRDLVRGIHPPVLADRGLTAAVQALALDSRLRTRVLGELTGRPSAPVESAAYFAICELLANAAKHSGASQSWVDVRHERGLLRISVTDDGRGDADPARGTGLRGIERRLAAFDGVLALDSPPGGPTIASMELPCALSSPKTSSC
jgi:signal transduction histidine kinase